MIEKYEREKVTTFDKIRTRKFSEFVVKVSTFLFDDRPQLKTNKEAFEEKSIIEIKNPGTSLKKLGLPP